MKQYIENESLVRNDDLKFNNEHVTIKEANKKIARNINDLLKSRKTGTVVKINNRFFTVKENTSGTIHEIFEEFYPGDDETKDAKFYDQEVMP